MKVLLIHLSDLHLRGTDDFVLGRASDIASAVRDRDSDISACFLVVSGDTAFSGLDSQYWLALEFLLQLKEELASYLNSGTHVQIVVIPGNHDCNFETSNSVRDRILDGVENEPEQASDDNIIETSTAVQDDYFRFLKELDEGNDLKLHSKLYYEYRPTVNDHNVLFRCYNTAWMSRLHERQGRLVYPLDKVTSQQGNYSLTVSLLHHPYSWLQSENARALKRQVQEASDIVLTGHEHEQDFQVRLGIEEERTRYIEGGVLQVSPHESRSTFNALLVDLAAEKQKYFQFMWDDQMYKPTVGSDEIWSEFQVNTLRARQDFDISDNFEKYLEEPGVALYHSAKGYLKLSDIFRYPDLRDMSGRSGVPRLVKGEYILDRILEDRKVMILGADEAGKTTLAKGLFREMHEKGLVPLFVDGSDIRPSTEDRFRRDVYSTFEEQYSSEALEKYKQIGKARRVLIIDNFHQLNLRYPPTRKRFMASVDGLVDYYVLLADDYSQQFGDLVTGESVGDPLSQLPRYQIQELGHLAREDVIDKWFALYDDFALGLPELSRKVNEAHHIINTVIGKNFVPSYPVFVLSILQAKDIGRPVDASAGTNGYFYELFIKTSLAKMSSSMEYDVKIAYLSFLACRIFVERLENLSEAKLREIHAHYELTYDLQIPFDNILRDLELANILEESTEGHYNFKYKYAYYYFVANYFKEHITEESVRTRISEMSATIYIEEHANILLFLAHLIKDPYTINEMLDKAKRIFADVRPARFEDDIRFFNEEATPEEIRYSERVAANYRRELLERSDELEREVAEREDEGAVPDSSDEDAAKVFEFDVAMKTIQILGQMLKNFPGTLDAEQKVALADECYALGLRAIAPLFAVIKEASDELINTFVDYAKTEYGGKTDRDLVDRAKRDIYRFAELMALVVVAKVGQSVGAPALAPTYRRVLGQNPSDAMRLIDASIKLDHESRFPDHELENLGEMLKANPFAMMILRYLVVTHLYMFKIELRKKQRVCAALGIPYDMVMVTDPKLRKVSNKAPKPQALGGLQ